MNRRAVLYLALATGLGCWGVYALNAEDDTSRICAPGYARSQRLPADLYYPLAHRVFARDGIPWEERHSWIVDHRIPLCAGGTNDIDNLQLQRPDEAAVKDRLEVFACKAICSDRVSSQAAREWFTDWKASYRRVFGTAP